MKYCSRCGTENAEGDNYCTSCGWTLNSDWRASTQKQNKKKASPAARILAGIFFLLLLVALLSVFSKNNASTSSTVQQQSTTCLVVYEVTGKTRSVSVTLSNGSGNTEQYANYRVPFRMSFQMRHGQFAYISAQNDEDEGYITSSIYVDEKLFQTSTSRGAYVIASASGLVP